MQLQKINFKVRQHGSLKIEDSVYKEFYYLLASAKFQYGGNRAKRCLHNKNIQVKSFLDRIENSMNS